MAVVGGHKYCFVKALEICLTMLLVPYKEWLDSLITQNDNEPTSHDGPFWVYCWHFILYVYHNA